MNISDHKQLLSLYFLGPKGEQRKLFQEMIELINNDVIFWRRNFHPKDPPAIAYRTLNSQRGQEWQENLIQSLVELLADLKMDLPFFSPRYLAHMTADVSLPGLLGYYAGLLYNANNVSAEASPVTLKYELEVGRQFARLAGYDSEKSFGHITSGGTVANFESVFYNKASRFLPATMGLVIRELGLPWPEFLPTGLWPLLNIPLKNIPELIHEFKSYGMMLGLDLTAELKARTPAELGDRCYWDQLQNVFNERLGDPVIIVPSTAHYSWSKASHLFGIGRKNCLEVLIEKNLSLSVRHFSEVLRYCREEKRPVIQTVCVLGSTEYGSFDPLHLVLEELGASLQKGLYSPVHIDAAYGGYFKAMFVKGEKFSELSATAETELPELDLIFKSMASSDSFTIDPHKLGHTPYGAGVFVTKHGFAKEFVAEDADYCLTTRDEEEEDTFPLGKYILEGSKPGASATSVYFSNKLIPLNSDGYGRLLLDLIKDAKEFQKKLLELNEGSGAFSRHFEVRALTAPQSNLVCFYIRPKHMTKLSEINGFNSMLLDRYFPKPTNHIQEFDYFVSKTKLKGKKLVSECQDDLMGGFERDEDSIQLIRMVFLNQWSSQENFKKISYVEDFINQIKQRCEEFVGEN